MFCAVGSAAHIVAASSGTPVMPNTQRANTNATTGISTIFSAVTAATSAARPPRPGNGAPRSEIPNAISAPGTAMPGDQSQRRVDHVRYRGPGGRQHDAE